MELSQEEKFYVGQSISSGIRTDGRSIDNYRKIQYENNFISHCNSSVRFKLGNTHIVLAIKAEVTPIPADIEQILNFNIEGIGSIFGENYKSSQFKCNQYISTLKSIYNSKSNGFALNQLIIQNKYICWTLFIDTLVLEDDGNLVDAITIATYISMKNLNLPFVDVTVVEGQTEVQIDNKRQGININLRNFPISNTYAKISNSFIADPTKLEEQCSDTLIFIAVNEQGVSYIMKQGCQSISVDQIVKLQTKSIAFFKQINTLIFK